MKPNMSKTSETVSNMIERYKDDIDSIMNDIETALVDNGFEFTSNNKKTEFIVKSTEWEEILNLIHNTISLPKIITNLIISVKKTKKNTYIRQRIK